MSMYRDFSILLPLIQNFIPNNSLLRILHFVRTYENKYVAI